MLSWFNLTILSVLFLVAYYFLSKKLLKRDNDIDPQFYGACLQLATGLIAMPVALASGFTFHLTLESGLLIIAMMTAYNVGPSLYYIGFKHIDLSETTILNSLGILWSVVLGASLLKESITPTKVVGVGLVALAILLVSYQPQKKLIGFSRHELFILTATFFYALGAVLDNRLVTFSNPASYMAISFTLAGLGMMGTNAHRFRSIGIKTITNAGFAKTVIANGAFLFLTYYSILLAYRMGGEVSRMYPIQQIDSVLVPMIGILLFREKNKIPQKILAVAIVIVAVFLIKI